MSELDKAFDPSNLERDCYERWEKNGYFVPNHPNQDSYCIMIPPPNVTGSLHMGHAFQQTLMDILIRYHRMKGENTLWQVGTDHAGIATQMVVERQLPANETRHSLGREAFIQKVWDWKAHSGDNITRQLRRIGASVDWSRERFTMDEGLSEAVKKVFIQLYEEKLIYRGKRLVNWDPVLKTAVSDLEVESIEETGTLWYIQYPLVTNPQKSITIATTRPETLLGDVAVAVHPDDPKYQSLIGEKVQLPLTDRQIPIISDPAVEPEFGTGCVKITPAHDFNDYDMGKRHDLPQINILNLDATLNDNVPKAYQGMDRFKARKQILADLEALNLLVKTEPHNLFVPKGDRSGAILEPLLTDQWFVSVQSLAKPAIDAVKQGEIRFVPENWSKTYFEWMNNIQDWCISRQLWWGHQIPAWYDDQGNVYVGQDEADVRQKHNLDDDLPLKQDEDVLDTWFSSALWPFSTLGWPEQTNELKTFYPTQVLVTGFDIIFFWVARMIMFGLKFTDQVPFKEVYIHGLIQDQDGQKMSKTKGNVLDPIDVIDGIDLPQLIEKRTIGLMQPQLAEKIKKNTQKQFPEGIPAHGTDALRMTFAALATTGRHIRFDLSRAETSKHFCNKLWNAARYVLLNTEGKATSEQPKTLNTVDRWILSIWQDTKNAVETHLAQYRFDLAIHSLYEFIWNEYCDWYLELTKPILTSSDESSAEATRYTLLRVLEEILRVLHPFMPYITEAIWQKIAPKLNILSDTIMVESYPTYDSSLLDQKACEDIDWIKLFILGIRNIRGEMNIKPSQAIPLFFQNAQESDERRLKAYEALLISLAKLASMDHIPSEKSQDQYATALVGNLELLVPMEGLIDREAEMARLEKELQKLNKELDKLSVKLQNSSFIERAPKAIVDQEQLRQAELKIAIEQLETKRSALQMKKQAQA